MTMILVTKSYNFIILNIYPPTPPPCMSTAHTQFCWNHDDIATGVPWSACANPTINNGRLYYWAHFFLQFTQMGPFWFDWYFIFIISWVLCKCAMKYMRHVFNAKHGKTSKRCTFLNLVTKIVNSWITVGLMFAKLGPKWQWTHASAESLWSPWGGDPPISNLFNDTFSLAV